jgi:CRISP-associated protein Cas1
MMSFPDFDYKQTIFYFSSKKELLKFRADNIVVIDEDNKVKQQHSCHRVFALFIIGNITITSVVLEKAKKFGFPVILLARNLKVTTYFNNVAEGNFLLRKKQYNDHENNLIVAKQLVTQKINNQISLLQNLRYKTKEEKNAIETLNTIKPKQAENACELLGFEGNASKIFFPVYFRQINWIRREPRTKRDINNLLLDIGYTYIFNFIEAITVISHIIQGTLCHNISC